MNSLQGHLLVASTDLRDPNFERTVVLILRHSEEGAYGLILNRITNYSIKEVWEKVKISEAECHSGEYVRIGGPVEGREVLMAIHTTEDLGDFEILPGAYYTEQLEAINRLVSLEEGQVRFFHNCSGWGPNQLEGELEEGSWLTLPATLEHLFYTEDDLWLTVIRQINDALIQQQLRIRHVPKDVEMN